MPERAHITSVEALEAFRATLLIYLSKARPALEEVSADVARMRMWLQNDQRIHWEGQVRRRTRAVEEAQQALFGARISNLREATDGEQKALQKARRALQEAEEKLRRLKQWNREFDNRVQPMVKEMDKTHTVLTTDMVRAVTFLTKAVETLQDYADVSPTYTSPPPPAAADGKTDLLPRDAAEPSRPAGETV
jgi:chromosome segregation ATPase